MFVICKIPCNFALPFQKGVLRIRKNDPWCNGSTSDFGSAC